MLSIRGDITGFQSGEEEGLDFGEGRLGDDGEEHGLLVVFEKEGDVLGGWQGGKVFLRSGRLGFSVSNET